MRARSIQMSANMEEDHDNEFFVMDMVNLEHPKRVEEGTRRMAML